MTPKAVFLFPAALCGIVLIGEVAGYAATGERGVALTTLVGFLPVAFYMVYHQLSKLADENKALRQEIDDLRG